MAQRDVRRDERLAIHAAYALAGHAVAAAYLGVRFGTLALSRDFAIADAAAVAQADHLWMIVHAGPAAEANLTQGNHGRLNALASPRQARLRATVVARTGPIDAHAERQLRLAATHILRSPGNAAVAAVAARLTAGEVLGYFTARRLIRAATDAARHPGPP